MQSQETNRKQKFQKPQNENICLIYLKTKKNGNFHFLSFCHLVCSIKKKGKRNVNLSTNCNQNCNMIDTFSHPDNKNYKKYKTMIKVLEYQEILCNFAQIYKI